MENKTRLLHKTKRKPSVLAVPQTVYLGLELDYDQVNQQKIVYAVAIHDGYYTIDFEFSSVDVSKYKTEQEKINGAIDTILGNITSYVRSQNFKVQAIGLGAYLKNQDGKNIKKLLYTSPTLASRIWLELDALPFIVHTKGMTVDERASSAVRKTVVWISPLTPGSIPRISVGYRHEVEVDLNGMIKLVDLLHYEKTVCPETWRVINTIANEIRAKNICISFFNSTPQGGGVALMRHALVRLCLLLKLDIHWFVAKPKPEIFDITKRKFHNVLQGVSSPDVRLTKSDKEEFITWSNTNAERFWSDDKGPIKISDVIIIDDPQVCGIIPHIKKNNPTCKIIYRSHIEICADLIRKNPNGPQAETWNFLYQFISQVDLFVSHPIANFIPDNVPRKKIVLLPASTDPLDGLNKELKDSDKEYYKLIYNRLSNDQCGVVIDFRRPYIVQVARFDPKKLKNTGWDNYGMPSLIICGAGSIDDPDGTLIYEQIHSLLSESIYQDIVDDISVVRLPPCDQLFNTMLRCAHVVLQLSTREGFEVKVTEALAKGVPVVAFKAGGIPLQIRHGETGFLADVGDTSQVADYLYQLFNDDDLHNRMSQAAKTTVTEEYFTVFQTLNWLYIINQLSNSKKSKNISKDNDDDQEEPNIVKKVREEEGEVFVGNGKLVKELWTEKYNYKGKKYD
ncbi:607_t:CDS:2 [Entrophospora sp. SA101]|nr:6147_t:CDS:2 [Entrophospora sp. SA101]CAJ0755603.1 607_t:CDS:2 [Entrophospora sp. SA101]CAJ0883240.1 12567_t:CDS:2 [Entrophospora sp. SA101]